MSTTSEFATGGLQTIARRESALLAPLAMFSADTRGRQFPEPEHPYRGPFQRDRDRILHSSAYRRLSGKTQVFTDMGDYHRTRLTHTMEVASIARTIGRALGLNEDLIEALALFHDIGHPPFGHAGEDALNECLADQGGFSHNRQALTIVQELEIRCHDYPGLNLSWEVLDGQKTRADKPNASGRTHAPLLEVQVVDLADSITYNAHDTDDAVMLGWVDLEELSENSLIADLLDRIDEAATPMPPEMRRKALVHALIDVQVADVLGEASRQLTARGFRSAADVQQQGFRLASSDPMAARKEELERFLYQRVYRHPRLISVRAQAQNRIRKLFRRLSEEPALMPAAFVARIDQVGVGLAVGDYLSSMTDRCCNREFTRRFESVGGGFHSSA